MAKGKRYSEQKDVRVDFTPMVDMNMLLITFFMLCTTMIKSQTLQIALPTNEENLTTEEKNKASADDAITIILDTDSTYVKKLAENGKDSVEVWAAKDFVYYYEGKPSPIVDGVATEDKVKEQEFLGNTKENDQTIYHGIRNILRDRNKQVVADLDSYKAKWKANGYSTKKEANDSMYQAEAKAARNNENYKRPVVVIKATPKASYRSVVSALDEMQINGIVRYQLERFNSVDSAMIAPLVQKRPQKRVK